MTSMNSAFGLAKPKPAPKSRSEADPGRPYIVGIVWVTLGFLLLGPLVGLAVEAISPRYYRAFVDLGDHLSLFAALASLLLWWLHESTKKADERRQRRRTARYWVLYNALNRCNQDLTTYHHLRRVVHGETYNKFKNHFAETNPPTEMPPQTEALTVELHKAFREVSFFLDGFSRTWTNDDVLSEALAFDFSLLTEPEKKQTLAYFENYNTMQDAVNFVLPFLKLDARTQRRTGSDHEQISEHHATHVVDSLEDIQKSLRARIKDAWDIWGQIRNSSHDRFNEIEERFSVLKDRARNVDIVL